MALTYMLDRHTIDTMKRVSLFLTEPQIETLKAMARVIGVPMAEALRRLLDEGLRKERDARDRHTGGEAEPPQGPE